MNSYTKVLESQDFNLDNESSLMRVNPCDSGIYTVRDVRSLFNIDLRPLNYKEEERVIISAGKTGTYIEDLNGEIILNY
jgi:hypothetical protein